MLRQVKRSPVAVHGFTYAVEQDKGGENPESHRKFGRTLCPDGLPKRTRM